MLRTLLTAALLSCLPIAAGVASAEGTSPKIGLAKGASVPEVMEVTSGGAPVSLASIAGQNGTVVVFFRSADWCPFCKKQLIELESAAAPLAEAGWNLAALSYDSVETLAKFKARSELSYTLISDEDSSTIRSFGLFNEDSKEGSRFYGIPHPAIVFVGADGTVREMLREEGYKDRPPAELVVSTALSLN